MATELTLDELRTLLDELSDEGWPGTAEIRIAHQPTFPLYASAVTVFGDEDPDALTEVRGAIYIAGSGQPDQQGYLPSSVASDLKAQGWQ